MSSDPRAEPLSAPVYRDPVYDGATDPVVVAHDGGLVMLYTQRRATHPSPGPGVSWVHGSRIGVARSADGASWDYAGTLEPTAAGLVLTPGHPPADVGTTHWAPDVIHDGRRWRMYLTEIDGVPSGWAGHARAIVEYVSDDLAAWTRRGPIPLASDRVIDAAVARCPDGRWRLWCKDEAAGSTTAVAASDDLETWTPEGTAIGGRAHEGPAAFALGGWWWMIVDEWRGMAVHRSSDAVTWQRQGGPDDVILGEADGLAGGLPVQIGRHGSVRVVGDEAVLTYFTHPWWDGSDLGANTAEDAAVDARRSAVFSARLAVEAGRLVCLR